VIVVGPPGSPVLLTATVDTIEKQKIAKAYPNLVGTFPDIYIKGYFRLCIPGEF